MSPSVMGGQEYVGGWETAGFPPKMANDDGMVGRSDLPLNSHMVRVLDGYQLQNQAGYPTIPHFSF
jgi:hypothetical protein